MLHREIEELFFTGEVGFFSGEVWGMTVLCEWVVVATEGLGDDHGSRSASSGTRTTIAMATKGRIDGHGAVVRKQ